MSFDRLAPGYDRLRSGGGWQQITDRSLTALAGATRLLDVGCGTGRFAVLAAERLGCRVWAVDPSKAMLAVARARRGAGSVGWREAAGERLPFRAGWFDAAHMHLVAHLSGDRPALWAELARVLRPGGRLLVVTFELEHFDQFHLVPYFPSIPRIDRARFPAPEVVVSELVAAGFGEAERSPVTTTARTPAAEVLERVRNRYISTLSELDADEYALGLERLEAGIAAGADAFDQVNRWCLISARRG